MRDQAPPQDDPSVGLTTLREKLAFLKQRLSEQKGLEEKLEATLHELQVHQEELRAQNEELMTAQREIEISHSRYLDLFDFAPVGYITLTPNNTIKEINLTAANMLGHSRSKLMGKPLFLYAAKETRKALSSHLREVWKGNASSKEINFVHKAGREFPAELVSIPNVSEPGRVVSCRTVIKDITERKRAEEALRQSEEKYRSLIENIPDVAWTADKDGHTVFISANVVDLCGYLPGEIHQAKSRFRFGRIHPDDVEEVKRAYESLFKQNDIYDVEYRTQTKDERWIWVHDRAITTYRKDGMIYADGLFSDITEKKGLEKKLKDSEERLESILKTVPDIIYRLDNQGNITFISDAVKKYGYEDQELLGRNIEELIHPEDRKSAVHRINERRTGERSTKALEVRLVESRNESVSSQSTPAAVHNEPVFMISAEGLYEFEGPGTRRFTGTQGIAKDCTALKLAEEERKKLERQLRQAEKMEAIGTLAGGIAHDFNNLLMGILGNVSLVLLSLKPDHPDYKRLKNIEELVQSASNLTKLLLGYARGGKYEVRATDLNDLIQKTSRVFSRTKKEVRLHEEYKTDTLVVEIDPAQIQQVLLNLYVNAYQAMPNGGNLYIETEEVRLDESFVKTFGSVPGRYAKIRVADTGIGMDESTKARIFEPFFTTKERNRGTGLGLASAYGIVKNHGGIINVFSKKGRGTTFEIYLPVCCSAVSIEKKLHEKLFLGDATILFVDDEAMVAEVVEDFLKQLGYDVITATSADEAINIFKGNKDRIDLVILDMVMPDMGGGKAYDKLKKINPDVKVLLSSGYSIDGEATKILNRGCNGFIQKPFNMNELSQKINEILSKEESC